MKNRYYFLLLILLTGCIADWDRELDTKKIDVELSESSTLFSNKNARLAVKEYRDILTFTFDYKVPANFTFPTDSFYGDTLFTTDFILRFTCDGKPVEVNPLVMNYAAYRVEADTSLLMISFPAADLRRRFHSEISLPMYVFHNIKAGKHKFTVEVTQTAFYGDHYDEEYGGTYRVTGGKPSLSGNATFELDVPEIYLTALYGSGMELQNDEEFSPQGMDFSFRAGLPDIYWTVYFPAEGEDDFEYLYWRSYEATYATEYNSNDTVWLYHFSPEDDLKIGVYDRDDLSGDDFLGDWFGSLEKLGGGKFTEFDFDHVRRFGIKTESFGCIND